MYNHFDNIFSKSQGGYRKGHRAQWYLVNFLIYHFVLVLKSLLDVRLCQTFLICQEKHLLLSKHHQRICRSHRWLIRASYCKGSPGLNPDGFKISSRFQSEKKTCCCTATFQRFSLILEEVKLVCSSLLIACHFCMIRNNTGFFTILRKIHML